DDLADFFTELRARLGERGEHDVAGGDDGVAGELDGPDNGLAAQLDCLVSEFLGAVDGLAYELACDVEESGDRALERIEEAGDLPSDPAEDATLLFLRRGLLLAGLAFGALPCSSDLAVAVVDVGPRGRVGFALVGPDFGRGGVGC